MIENHKSIVWKTHSAQATIASARYRCLLPALHLESLGYGSVIIQRDEIIDKFDLIKALIFVKSFSNHDLKLTIAAYQHGIPIILDLCDNIFVKTPLNTKFFKFVEMAKYASAIVTTGDELAGIIRLHVKDSNIVIIPDQIETPLDVDQVFSKIKYWRKKRYKLQHLNTRCIDFFNTFLSALKVRNPHRQFYFLLSRLKNNAINLLAHKFCKETNKKLRRDIKKVVWFGNRGASHSNSGMAALLEIKDSLEKINKKIPLELLVISNSISKFEKIIKPFPFATIYKTWNPFTIFNEIEECDVCVVPSSKDDFSLCKSPNRTLLALSLGVPVVATSIPALDLLSSCIILDDWNEGLLTYLTNPARVQEDINKSKIIINTKFTGKVVAQEWDMLLRKSITSIKPLVN